MDLERLVKLTNVKDKNEIQKAIRKTAKEKKIPPTIVAEKVTGYYEYLFSFKQLSGVSEIIKLEGTVGNITRRMYFFKDIHRVIGECDSYEKEILYGRMIRFNKWFVDILETSPKFTDSFIEYHPKFVHGRYFEDIFYQRSERRLSLRKHQGTIIDIVAHLEPCFSNLKKKCPVKTGRVHFVDMRRFTNEQFVIDQIKNRDKATLRFFFAKPKKTSFWVKYMFDKYFKKSKINIEFKRSQLSDKWDTYVTDYLTERYNDEYFVKIYGMTCRAWKEGWDNLLLTGFVILLYAPLLDLYTIARMFKKFNDKDHPYAQNIIVYTGGTHIKDMVKFLEDILHFDRIDLGIKNLDKQCLDISSLPLPLF